MNNVYIASCAESGGIYFCKSSGNGHLETIQKTNIPHPMFLAIEGDTLYALLRKPFENSENSGLITYRINSDGTLSDPSEILSTEGVVACHLSVLNEAAYCANYISGSVKKIPGKLVCHKGNGPHPTRQDSAHAHFSYVYNNEVFVCDLGIDTIMVYDLDLNLKYSLKTPDGSGARHLAFSDSGEMMYCINELSSTVSVFKKQGDKYEYLKDYPALPSDFTEKNTAAAIRIKDNRLYVSNRGHNSIAVFNIMGETLSAPKFYPCGGDFPRDINILGDYIFCTNQFGNTVTSLKIEEDKLSLTDFSLEMDEPLCIIFN